MKNSLIIIVCVFSAALAWKIGEAVHPTTLAVLVGVAFGALAGIPPAVIVLAATRRKEQADRAYPVQQPPVIFFGGQGQSQPPPQTSALPGLSIVNSTATVRGEIEHVDW